MREGVGARVDNPAFMPLGRLWHILATAGRQRPDDPGVLVRQGDRGFIEPAPFDQALQPSAQTIVFSAAVFQHRARPVNQQGSQRPVAALADAQQNLLVAAAMLPGHHA